MASPALKDITDSKIHSIQGGSGYYYIGSSTANWLCIGGSDIRPRHALLLRIGDKVRVQKPSEESIITIFSQKQKKDERLEYPKYLEDGDVLKIGNYCFIFCADTSRPEIHTFSVTDPTEIEPAKVLSPALPELKNLLPAGVLAHDPAEFGKQSLQILVTTTHARSGIIFRRKEDNKDGIVQEIFEPISVYTQSESKQLWIPENFFSRLVIPASPKLLEVIGEATGSVNKPHSGTRRYLLSYLYWPISLESQLLGGILLIGTTEITECFRQYFHLLGDLATNYIAPILKLLDQHKSLAEALEEAQQIQFSLVPADSSTQCLPLDCTVSLEFAGIYRPATQVAGDYLDIFFSQDRQELYFCIGDVSGKGPAAGLLMATVRAYLKLLTPLVGHTDLICENINRNLCQDLQKIGGKFMTMAMFRWDERTGKLYYTQAGEEHFNILRKDGNVEDRQNKGAALGMFSRTKYREAELAFDEGDTLVLATDGVWEAHNRQGIEWGKDNFHASIRNNLGKNAHDTLDKIVKELEKFTDGVEKPHDDVTLLVVQKKTRKIL